jgi:hypothetical protein
MPEKKDLDTWVKESFDLANEFGFASFPDFQILFTSPIRTFRSNAKGYGADEMGPDLDEVQAKLGELVKKAPARLFYMISPDNAHTVLKWLKPFDWAKGELVKSLESFERDPAPEGGTNQLGLVGEDRKWLLHFEYMPYDAFEIKIFGSSALCEHLISAFPFASAEEEE